MKLALLLFAAFLSLVSAAPSPSADDQTSFVGCPDMTIRCVKDGRWPGGIVGDIGKKPFVFSGLRCNQEDEHANTRECNQKFKEECDHSCKAFAPVPF